MRRDRLTQQTLAGSEVHNIAEICDIDCLLHCGPEAESKHELFEPPEDEFPDAQEEVEEIEKFGLSIAKSIQDQSEQFGRRRKFDQD